MCARKWAAGQARHSSHPQCAIPPPGPGFPACTMVRGWCRSVYLTVVLQNIMHLICQMLWLPFMVLMILPNWSGFNVIIYSYQLHDSDSWQNCGLWIHTCTHAHTHTTPPPPHAHTHTHTHTHTQKKKKLGEFPAGAVSEGPLDSKKCQHIVLAVQFSHRYKAQSSWYCCHIHVKTYGEALV